MTDPKQNNHFVVDDTRILTNIPPSPNVITFDADDYKVTKRTATITYQKPLFLQQYHTLIFKIDGQEYKFELTDRRNCNV